MDQPRSATTWETSQRMSKPCQLCCESTATPVANQTKGRFNRAGPINDKTTSSSQLISRELQYWKSHSSLPHGISRCDAVVFGEEHGQYTDTLEIDSKDNDDGGSVILVLSQLSCPANARQRLPPAASWRRLHPRRFLRLTDNGSLTNLLTKTTRFTSQNLPRPAGMTRALPPRAPAGGVPLRAVPGEVSPALAACWLSGSLLLHHCRQQTSRLLVCLDRVMCTTARFHLLCL